MYLIMISFFLFIFICKFILYLSMMISKKFKNNFEKMSPFECGFNPLKLKRIPFSLRFFLITIIFLIFDVEIALILPLILTMKMSNLMIWMLSMLMIMLILMIGLMYEWNQGALNWI